MPKQKQENTCIVTEISDCAIRHRKNINTCPRPLPDEMFTTDFSFIKNKPIGFHLKPTKEHQDKTIRFNKNQLRYRN